MRLENLFSDTFFLGLFESLLPDFILGFTFFTALVYAVLARRFDHQRSAIAMSSALGFALSTGLVWWEYDRGWSIKNLGPLAIGFAVIMLSMIMFQGIHRTGGTWAGAGIAFGASILVAGVLGVEWLIAPEIMHSLAVVGLTVGIMAFFLHSHGVTSPHAGKCPVYANREIKEIRHDMSDLCEDGNVGDKLAKSFGQIRKECTLLGDHPQYANEIMSQIRQMLPAEGWLTQRLARLRERIHLTRNGHIHKFKELKTSLNKLPLGLRKKARIELAETAKKLDMDKRMERLDNAVAENERRVRQLTLDSGYSLAKRDYPKLKDLLKHAERLQVHNDKLFRTIIRTEKKIEKAASDVVIKMAEEVQDVL